MFCYLICVPPSTGLSYQFPPCITHPQSHMTNQCSLCWDQMIEWWITVSADTKHHRCRLYQLPSLSLLRKNKRAGEIFPKFHPLVSTAAHKGHIVFFVLFSCLAFKWLYHPGQTQWKPLSHLFERITEVQEPCLLIIKVYSYYLKWCRKSMSSRRYSCSTKSKTDDVLHSAGTCRSLTTVLI